MVCDRGHCRDETRYCYFLGRGYVGSYVTEEALEGRRGPRCLACTKVQTVMVSLLWIKKDLPCRDQSGAGAKEASSAETGREEGPWLEKTGS